MHDRDEVLREFTVGSAPDTTHCAVSMADLILSLKNALADARRENDAMAAVVEAASDYADMLLRYEYGDDVSDHNDALIDAVRAHRARAKEGA